MSFREVFQRPHTILPVIHVSSQGQALRNAALARDAGADGVFLINHSGGWADLLAIHDVVSGALPGFWIGVNCLDLPPAGVFERISPRVGGVWSDNAGIREDQHEQPEAAAVRAAQRRHAPECLYFGGVAFKYQRAVADLEAAARVARDWVDVPTTSGPGTGHAADVEKIRMLKAGLGGAPLAIASGITPENVGQFLPHADVFLVATGISRTFDELDPGRLKSLVDAVREPNARRKRC